MVNVERKYGRLTQTRPIILVLQANLQKWCHEESVKSAVSPTCHRVVMSGRDTALFGPCPLKVARNTRQIQSGFPTSIPSAHVVTGCPNLRAGVKMVKKMIP